MDKIVNLTLPEWAWLDGGEHDGGAETLHGRVVIMHVRSASVVEIIEHDKAALNPATLQHSFMFGNTKYVVALHFCTTTDDKSYLLDMLKRAGEWYCDVMQWEVENGYDDIISLN